MRYFDNGSKLSMDSCALEARENENQSVFDYNIFSMYNDCDNLKKATKLTTEYPNLRFHTGHGVDCGIIDSDSKMKLNVELRSPGNQQLCARQFTAVPYLGRGTLVPNLESRLIHGIDTSLTKDCHNLAEYELPYHAPLTNCMSAYINKANYVPDTHPIGKISKDLFLKQRCANK